MRTRGRWTIGQERVPVVGTICMDFTMLDVTDRPQTSEGDEAVLFGDEPTAWDVAGWAGTTVWDVITHIGQRVPRVYIEDGRVVDVDARLP
jgi:alanine racemase